MSIRAYITREKKIWVNEDAGFSSTITMEKT